MIDWRTVPMPDRIKRLKTNDAGYPVPHFVEWIEGKPDFRVVSAKTVIDCIRFDLCWICGQQLGQYKTFAIGPMCAINRTSSEPPSHRDCAEYAVKVCPFMLNPHRPRRTTGLPEERQSPAGIHLDRNPGVTLLWITKSYRPFNVPNGLLIRIGQPLELLWFAEGRKATHAEIIKSINGGYPSLLKVAAEEGPEAVEALAACRRWVEAQLVGIA